MALPVPANSWQNWHTTTKPTVDPYPGNPISGAHVAYFHSVAHHVFSQPNVWYVGNPYQLDWDTMAATINIRNFFIAVYPGEGFESSFPARIDQKLWGRLDAWAAWFIGL